MVSLWGSKQDGEQGEDDENQNQPGAPDENEHSRPASHSRRQADPDERTRLLPPPAHGGYLSPDDPAVSTPLSLHSFTQTH